jgi:hypothetical protein
MPLCLVGQFSPFTGGTQQTLFGAGIASFVGLFFSLIGASPILFGSWRAAPSDEDTRRTAPESSKVTCGKDGSRPDVSSNSRQGKQYRSSGRGNLSGLEERSLERIAT